jgi:hypothetical protein
VSLNAWGCWLPTWLPEIPLAQRAYLIGQAVRERRLALGLSQVELASRARGIGHQEQEARNIAQTKRHVVDLLSAEWPHISWPILIASCDQL